MPGILLISTGLVVLLGGRNRRGVLPDHELLGQEVNLLLPEAVRRPRLVQDHLRGPALAHLLHGLAQDHLLCGQEVLGWYNLE